MKSKEKKQVYVGLCADIIHPGHLNIIREASKLGEITVGLLTDSAIASYKRLPFFPFEDRKIIVENIKNVSKVVSQDTFDYIPNLKRLKPDYVVHGDDWKTGIQANMRQNIIEVMAKWGGRVIDIPYTPNVSSTKFIDSVHKVGITPATRIKVLRRLLDSKKFIRVLEVHDGLSGMIVENCFVKKDNFKYEFDGFWSSSLTDSAARGKPDIEYVNLTSRLSTLNDVLEVTTKPIIYDGDSGGLPEHFVFMVRTLERLGVSAVIIEDKIGLKKNSLFGVDGRQMQDTIQGFSNKINKGKQAQISDDFMVIARTESLVLQTGIDDAIKRSERYIGAGADGIMVSCKDDTPDEFFKFCRRYSDLKDRVPLVAVPSTYSQVTERQLEDFGVNIVVYANHMLRSAYPAMVRTAELILSSGRAKEVENLCMPIKDIITLIPEGIY